MRRQRLFYPCLTLLLSTTLLLSVLDTLAFQSTAPIAHFKKSNRRTRFRFARDDKENKQDDKDAGNQLDDWLDKPFFNPLDYDDEDDSTWQARLANFVKSDYNLAEFLYAGTFLAIMLIISQELFRMQLYGADYVPFTSNSQNVNALWNSL